MLKKQEGLPPQACITFLHADGQSVPYERQGCEEQDKHIHWFIMLALITPWWVQMILAWVGWLALLGIDAAAICTLIWWVRSRDTGQPKQDHPLDYEQLQVLYLEQEWDAGGLEGWHEGCPYP